MMKRLNVIVSLVFALVLSLSWSSVGSCGSMNQEQTIAMSRQDYNELKEALMTSKDTLIQAKKQLDESNNQLTIAKEQLSQSNSQITLLKTQLATQKAEIATLKTQLTAASDSLNTAKKSLNDTQSDIDKLNEEHLRTEKRLRYQRDAWKLASLATFFFGMSF